jgi:hypothetical protein
MGLQPMIGIGELKMPRSRQRMADGGFTAAAWPDEKDWLCHNRRPLVPSVAKNENERTYYRCLFRNVVVKKRYTTSLHPITTVRKGALNVNLSLHLVFNQLYFLLALFFIHAGVNGNTFMHSFTKQHIYNIVFQTHPDAYSTV